MSGKVKASLSVIFRLVIAIVFIYAAVDKISDPYTFAVDIRNYQIIPEAFSNILAVILPWVELCCSLFILFGFYTRSSALLIASMLVVFIIAISLAMIRGLDIDCGCYHSMGNSSKVGFQKLIEDIIYLGMSIYLFMTQNIGPAVDSILKRKKH